MEKQVLRRIKELFQDRKYYLDLIHAGVILKNEKPSRESQEQQKVFLKELSVLEMLLSIELLNIKVDHPNLDNIQTWEDFQKLMKKSEE